MGEALYITPEKLMEAVPEVLKRDAKTSAICASVAEILSRQAQKIESVRLYSRIAQLPEGLLDILAYDFKVDWYDPDFSLDEKREILQSNWDVRRTIGTKYAVERAVSAIYPDTKVEEGFQYGGEPFHFKLLINTSYEKINREIHEKVMWRIFYYKNLRSVLDVVEYYDASGNATIYTAAGYGGEDLCDGSTAILY